MPSTAKTRKPPIVQCLFKGPCPDQRLYLSLDAARRAMAVGQAYGARRLLAVRIANGGIAYIAATTEKRARALHARGKFPREIVEIIGAV